MISDILKNENILCEIATTELFELAKIYENHQNRIPHAYSTIITGIDWAKKSKEKLMIFLSLGECWKKDGTFFVYMRFNCNNLCIFTLDNTGENVINGLFNSKLLQNIERFTNNELLLLFAIDYSICPLVTRECEKRNIKIIGTNGTMFCVAREIAISFPIIAPPEVYIMELEESSAEAINTAWPHKYPSSEKYIKTLIKMNGGFGVFSKSTHQLLSWVVISGLGQITMLQTLDGFKKKGYGKLILKKACVALANRGFNPLGTVLIGNIASEYLFQDVGFLNIGLCTYFDLVSLASCQ